MCIRMIPPEDVSVGTISATQASPITTTQCTASSCPSTTTAVRVNPVIVSPAVRVTPVIVSPVTTATVTIAPVTTAIVATTPVTTSPATEAPLCTKCDIAAIAPSVQDSRVFESTNTVDPDGCTQTNVICRRTDDQICTEATLEATSAAGASTISSAMNAIQVSGSLTCQADSTYSSGSVTGITKLLCSFDRCAPACATCDIDAARPLMNPPGTSFMTIDITPNGQRCKLFAVGCFHDTELCPSITLFAELDTGREEFVFSATISDSVSAEIDCATDGTLRYMGLGPIVRFRCEFTGC